jgi:hypothetical protein
VPRCPSAVMPSLAVCVPVYRNDTRASKVKIDGAHACDDNMASRGGSAQSLQQPSMSLEETNASDIKNSIHCSQFSLLLGQTLVVGLHHPDDKAKGINAYYEGQKTILVADYRTKASAVANRHYPGLLEMPKKTSPAYKAEIKALKDDHQQKMNLVNSMFRCLLDVLHISEFHAFYAEVPGWNNATYRDVVGVSRQGEHWTSLITTHSASMTPKASTQQALAIAGPNLEQSRRLISMDNKVSLSEFFSTRFQIADELDDDIDV